MESIANLELLSVGAAIAGTALLGFIILLNDFRSSTNRAFFYFASVTVCWSIVNYAYYQFPAGHLSFWLLRFVIFFATWHAFSFFHLSLTFPEAKIARPRWYTFFVFPITILVSLLTLTPLVFKQITTVSANGSIGGVQNGPAIPLFGILVFVLVLSAIFNLARKTWTSPKAQRRPYSLLFYGMLVTFMLLLTFNFFLPAVYDNPRYIPFGAFFLLPFIICSALAILRYKLFNIRVAAIGVLSFALSMATLGNIVFAPTFAQLLFSLSQFILVLIFSFWLIQGVLREVAQREQIEALAEDLEHANEKLKQLDQLKSEFLSVASHQLRAPITAIKGYIANVLEGSYGVIPEYLKDPLEVVQESTRVMTSSIEDYLNVSRIEQGRMKYEMSSVDITALAKRATNELMPIAQKKNLVLSFAESPTITLEADFGKIKQVFTNLIDNAIKYTEKGSITVSVTVDGTRHVARFMTSDTGVGIPADEINKLFEKFTRARGANNVNTTGTGLGLYVAKNLVEGHHGKVWAESDGTGKGSRFIVELPLVQPPQPEEPAQSGEQAPKNS